MCWCDCYAMCLMWFGHDAKSNGLLTMLLMLLLVISIPCTCAAALGECAICGKEGSTTVLQQSVVGFGVTCYVMCAHLMRQAVAQQGPRISHMVNPFSRGQPAMTGLGVWLCHPDSCTSSNVCVRFAVHICSFDMRCMCITC